MILATQYYRPPFPEPHRWAEDLRAIRATGVDAIYVWACWGWMEPEPGRFVFDDLDDLVELAGDAGLRVILNTIAEIQPFWIHRVVPDGCMVDHLGREVASSVRRECNVGLTPGGCTDHPGVRELMAAFLDAVARRYAAAPHLAAWDLWNETRWAVHADGHVCHCPHTVAAFRSWLDGRHGGLEGVSRAWRRRYSAWDDVLPGKLPGRTYTEMLEFQAFLSWRAAEHMHFRERIVRAADGARPVVAHAAEPATHSGSYELEQALSRGNDWELADMLDGFGASLFPAAFGWSAVTLGARIEAARSAAGEKLYWVGEIQGGTAREGIEVRAPVTGADQQRWLWSAVARGAKAVSFWCWRDEVFGRESSGFGIVGSDGFAGDRLAALGRTAGAIGRHRELLASYRPDAAQVGVVFDPVLHQLDWAQHGPESQLAQTALVGCLEALERLQVPYEVLEARHRAPLAALRAVVMPWPLVVDPGLADDLLEWVEGGGTLVVESELDAYDRLGFYRYADERPFANALGLHSLGRRPLTGRPLRYSSEAGAGSLEAACWLEPMRTADGGEALAVEHVIGRGRVLALGTFSSIAYHRLRTRGFERLLQQVVAAAGASPGLRCTAADGDVVQWRSGRSGDERLLFVTNAGARINATFSGRLLNDVAHAGELFGEREIAVVDGRLATSLPAAGQLLLSWRATD